MQRVVFSVARCAVLPCSLLASACESSAPASTRTDESRRTASEWLGSHEQSARPGSIDIGGAGTWVLHIGDSFAHASFQQNLAPLIKATGARYVVDATTATYTTTWAFGPNLHDWLARRPSLVIVTLGANEVDIPVPSMHARAVERIAHMISGAGAACVWTTPPLWKTDTGILQVIHDHCAPCLYFDSDAIMGQLGPKERRPDGIHPNERGGARWTEAFWRWLVDHRDANRSGWALRASEPRL